MHLIKLEFLVWIVFFIPYEKLVEKLNHLEGVAEIVQVFADPN